MGKQVDRNEFWFIAKNPITKVGVFPYLGKQISEDCEPNKIYMVLRPKEELFKKETLDSLKLLPLVDEHEMLGKDVTPAEEKGVDGIIGEQIEHDNDTIYSDIKIFSDEMKEKIKDGKKELSLGYWCSYEKQEGTYKGQRYDYIQRNIIGNHLALVDRGRMGSDVKVYDKAIENKVYCCDSLGDIDIEKMEYKKNTEEKGKMAEQKKKVEATDEDKRKLIDEIGGMLKDKVSEEEWRTIVGKIEKVAYNASEAGKGTDEDEDEKKKKKEGEDEDDKDKKPVKDKCGKDEDKDKDDKDKKDGEDEDDDEDKDKDKKGMDEADFIKRFARKEKLGKEVEKVLGTFDHSEMTEQEIAVYACDKLELGAEKGQEISTIKGYLKAVEKNKVSVSMKAEDSDVQVAEDKSFAKYLENAKK